MNTLLFVEAKVKKKNESTEQNPEKVSTNSFSASDKKIASIPSSTGEPEERRMKAILSGDPKQTDYSTSL